jgi:hypothetical protein
MLYYRVAFRVDQKNIQTAQEEQENIRSSAIDQRAGKQSTVLIEEQSVVVWKWRSTLLTSPHALFTLLRAYSYIPKEQIRIFFASSESDMDEMLSRQNQGLVSSSVTADAFLAGQRMDMLDVRRLELEVGPLHDHDEPYVFTLPQEMKMYLAWVELMRKYEAGELES